MTAICKLISSSAFAIKRITAPKAPGPAIKGVAMGNTEISRFDKASCSSASVVDVPPEWRANTMSIPINKRRIPPAVLKAASEMPKLLSRKSPIKAKTIRIEPAISTARTAICCLCLVVAREVRAAYIAATSGGPIVAKKVAKATVAVSIISSFMVFLLAIRF